MTTPEKSAVASHIAVATLSLVVAGCVLVGTLAGLRTLDGVNKAIATVNAPCVDNGHQVVCGTLAQVGQTTKNVGILAAQGAEQVKQSGALIQATTANLNKAGDAVVGLTTHLSQTADALTQTAQNASTTIQGMQTHLAPVLDSSKATLDAATGQIKDFASTQRIIKESAENLNTVIQNPNIPLTLGNVQATTAQLAIITADAKVEERKFVYPPKTPWYKKIAPTVLKSGELAYDFIR